MGKFSHFFNKYKDFLVYMVFGACATAINMGAYALLYEKLSIGNIPSTIIAWVLAVTFAFFTNKLIVFSNHTFSAKTILFELWSFYGSRLATGLLDVLIMWLAVDILGLHAMLWKLIANLIVGVINYLMGKLIIFKKK